MSNIEMINSAISSKSKAYELLEAWCIHNLASKDVKPISSLLEAIEMEFGVVELGKWFRGDFE